MAAEITTRQIRDRAVEIIEAHGLCKGRFLDPDGRRCIAGAIFQALVDLDGYGMDWISYRAIYEIEQELQCGILSIWNDAPERTKEQVVAALRGPNHGR